MKPATVHLAALAFLVASSFFPAPAAAFQPVTVAAVGDVMMGSDFPHARLPRRDGRDLLAAAAPYLKRADLALANLEGPLLEGGKPAKEPLPGRRYLFRTPPRYAQNLKQAGIDMVSLANNHALDFGGAGLASTRQALAEAGVAFSGKRGELARFTVRGVRVGILALACGAPPRSIVFPSQALKEIAREAGNCDILILSIHAGAEGRAALHQAPGEEYYLGEPRGDLVRFARAAIELGADLVVAHGPHVPRALELYQDRLIAYSLGNFATYGGVNVSRESGYAPLLTVQLDRDGSFLSGSLDSFRQLPFRAPALDPRGRALRLMRRLSAEDFPLSPLLFGDDGAITRKSL